MTRLTAARVLSTRSLGVTPFQVEFVASTAFTSFNTGNTTQWLSKPAGVIAGDLLIMQVSTRNSFPDVAGPQGSTWTSLWRIGVLETGTHDDPLGATNDVHQVWWKIAGSSEPTTYSLGITDDGVDGQIVHLLAFRNATTVEAWSKGTDATSVVAPSVTGSNGGVLVGFWASPFESGSFTAVPGSMTGAELSGPVASGHALSGWEELSADGATSTRTPTHTTMDLFQVAALVAIR